jgi:hypothetical protein
MRTTAASTATLCIVLILVACSSRTPEPRTEAEPTAAATRDASEAEATETPASPVPAAEETSGLPPAATVCVEHDGGALALGTARPSRAGVYDPSMPVVPEHLNWMVDGVGCVTYPGGATRQATCAPGGGPAPVVTRALCAQ